MLLIDKIVVLVLFMMMLGVGLNISIKDFRKLFRSPKIVFFGLTMQAVVLPFIAFIIAFSLPIPYQYKIGIGILSLCPGGTTSNFLSYLFGLNTALSVSLTIVNSFLIFIFLPFGIEIINNLVLSSNANILIPFFDIFKNIFLFILIPVSLGIIVNYRFSLLVNKSKNLLKILIIIFFIIAFTGKFFASEDIGGVGLTFDEVIIIFPIILMIHLISLIVSFTFSRYFFKSDINSLTIATEVGLQNTPLALVISSLFIESILISKPILMFATFSFITTSGFIFFVKKVIFRNIY